jgi:predicted enzyme related to lactoylglutathione lyase
LLGSSDVVAFVTVSDPVAAKQFYREILGLTLVEEAPYALIFDANGTTLRVAFAEDVRPAPYTVAGWTVTDIAGVVEALSRRGVHVERFEVLDLDDRGVWTTPGGDLVAWFKDPHGNVLSITELSGPKALPRRSVPSWIELLTLMVHAPDPEPTIHGAIRSFAGRDETKGWFGWHSYGNDPLPVFAGARPIHEELEDQPAARPEALPPIRVWRDGHKIRIEEPDGQPDLIVDDTTCWRFDRAHDEPVASPRSALQFAMSGTELLTRREPTEFMGTDFTRPTGKVGATVFLGRPAWTVELAPPQHKPYPIQLVVDAETGIVLQQRNDGFGSVDEWVEFVVGDQLDADLFRWEGPVRDEANQRAISRVEHEAMMAARRSWFETNVASLPLRLELDIGVHVHEFDPSGAFQAGLGDQGDLGALARRPHSDAAWDLHWHGTTHEWSDGSWDWAVTFFRDDFGPESLEVLKRQLEQANRDV